MKIIVNQKELEIFEGAKVKDALRLYYVMGRQSIPFPLPDVTDGCGNKVAHDGTLLPNAIVNTVHDEKDRP